MKILKKILSFAQVYNGFKYFIGADKGLKIYIKEYIKPSKGDKILDVGCGPADILDYFKDIDYTGFDINPQYISYATKKYALKGKFYCQTVSQNDFNEKHSYDIVLATGILHHLTNQEALELFNLANKVLKPVGRLITLDGCYTENQSTLVKFLLSKDRGSFVRTETEYLHLASSVFDNIKISLRTDILFIPYTHIIMECTNNI